MTHGVRFKAKYMDSGKEIQGVGFLHYHVIIKYGIFSFYCSLTI